MLYAGSKSETPLLRWAGIAACRVVPVGAKSLRPRGISLKRKRRRPSVKKACGKLIHESARQLIIIFRHFGCAAPSIWLYVLVHVVLIDGCFEVFVQNMYVTKHPHGERPA